MEFKKKNLNNGLSIIGEVNRSVESSAVGFFVKTGSRDEPKEINGVSHFLEHMVFKGNERISPLEVNQAFDRTGAHFNASTSDEATVFYAAVLPEYLEQITNLWIELMNPALREEDFRIEKNVIKEEIAMYEDTPHFDVMDRCRSLHFEGHPCGNSILGTNDGIDAMSAEQMREYFFSRYVPSNMTLAVAGNFDWEKICSVAEKACANWQKKQAQRQLQDCAGSKKTQRVEKSNLSREHICLMSAGPSAQDDRRFAATLLANIIGDISGSRYFWELVDKAVAETATMHFGPMDGTGVFSSYIRCGTDKVEQVLEVVGNLLGNIKTEGVTERELTRAKNKILSALVIKNELPMGRLVDLGMNWTYLRQYRTVEQDLEAIRSVSIDDVRSAIEAFDPSQITRVSLGPSSSK